VLRDELARLGWIENRNVQLDFRFGYADERQTNAVAADLVRLAPDVIVTVYVSALRAAQQQTKTIPIVFAGGGDPLQNGMVSNPARPEGNVTGFSLSFGSLGGKWLELLKEIALNITRVAYLWRGVAPYRSVETAAQLLGVQAHLIMVSDIDALKAAVQAFAAEPNGGLIFSPGQIAFGPPELIRLAAQYRIPAVYGGPLAPDGGLLCYYPEFTDALRGAAGYVDRLLHGAKVGDLPVQYPTHFHLAINLKTARALGLNVPQSILVRADEVIQ
jgi:putative ABC transport system substrate-binding protein